MGIFEQFPYTNFHDLNLDWILNAIRSMDKKLDEFVASNVLSYAEPIQWDIETQYAKNTVVVDPKTGTAYMSINPVPVGQLLTNKYYWQPIFNYDEIVNTLKKQIAAVQADQNNIIPVAANQNALVWVANKLYRLTKSLASGSKIIENENAVPVTVEEIINDIDAQLYNEISDRESADTTITNKLNKEISDRTELISKDSSGNTVVTSTNGALYLNTKNPIKYKAPVTLNDDFNYIPMTDTNGNEYKVLVDKGNSSINRKFNKYVIIGDSYAAGYTPEGNVTSWSTILQNRLGNTCYANLAVGGLGLSTSITGDQNATNTVNKLTADNTVDSVIYCGGRNDANGTLYAEISQGVEDFVNACHAKFPNAVVYIGFIGWDSGITEYAQARSFFLAEAISAYSNNTKNAAYTYLANSELILHDNNLMASDGKHPNSDGQKALANGIYSCLYGGTYGFHNSATKQLTAVDGQTIYLREIFDHGDDLLDIYTNQRILLNVPLSHPKNSVKLCDDFPLRYMIPSGYGFTKISATFDIQFNDTHYAVVPGFLKIQNINGNSNELYAEFTLIADNNYPSGTLNAIEIRGQGTVQLI